MKKLNSKGFGAIEVILLIVLVGLLIGAGLFVWNGQRYIKDKNDNVSKSADSSLNANNQQAEINNSKNNKKFSQVPAGLQQAILTAYKINGYSACVKGNTIIDNNGKSDDINLSYKQDAAIVPIGCNGGALYFFGYTNKTWKKLESTQMGFSCALLKKYNIPVSWIFEKNDPSDSDMKQSPAQCFQDKKLIEYKGA